MPSISDVQGQLAQSQAQLLAARTTAESFNPSISLTRQQLGQLTPTMGVQIQEAQRLRQEAKTNVLSNISQQEQQINQAQQQINDQLNAAKTEQNAFSSAQSLYNSGNLVDIATLQKTQPRVAYYYNQFVSGADIQARANELNQQLTNAMNNYNSGTPADVAFKGIDVTALQNAGILNLSPGRTMSNAQVKDYLIQNQQMLAPVIKQSLVRDTFAPSSINPLPTYVSEKAPSALKSFGQEVLPSVTLSNVLQAPQKIVGALSQDVGAFLTKSDLSSEAPYQSQAQGNLANLVLQTAAYSNPYTGVPLLLTGGLGTAIAPTSSASARLLGLGEVALGALGVPELVGKAESLAGYPKYNVKFLNQARDASQAGDNLFLTSQTAAKVTRTGLLSESNANVNALTKTVFAPIGDDLFLAKSLTGGTSTPIKSFALPDMTSIPGKPVNFMGIAEDVVKATPINIYSKSGLVSKPFEEGYLSYGLSKVQQAGKEAKMFIQSSYGANLEGDLSFSAGRSYPLKVSDTGLSLAKSGRADIFGLSKSEPKPFDITYTPPSSKGGMLGTYDYPTTAQTAQQSLDWMKPLSKAQDTAIKQTLINAAFPETVKTSLSPLGFVGAMSSVSQETKPLTAVKQPVLTNEQQTENTNQFVKLMFGTSQDFMQQPKQIQTPLQTNQFDNMFKEGFASMQIPAQVQNPQQTQREGQVQTLINIPLMTETTKTKIPEWFYLMPPKKLVMQNKRYYSKPIKRAAYTAELRRFGKFITVGKSTNPQAALEIGKRAARMTLGASTRVRTPTGFLPVAPSKEFRQAKGNPFILVQRRNVRLSSPQERTEIKMARNLAKMKAPKFKPMKMFGGKKR